MLHGIPLPKEWNGTIVVNSQTDDFHNWAGTVRTQPFISFGPQSAEALCNIVQFINKYEAQTGKKLSIRVYGHGHTWGPLPGQHFFTEDNQIAVSLLPKHEYNAFISMNPVMNPYNKLEYIELTGKPFIEEGTVRHLCRIGAATTNEDFRRWSVSEFMKGKPSWTVPYNVIMVEIVMVAATLMMCHGGGHRHKTLADRVTQIRFVNPRGVIQTVGYNIDDPEEKQKSERMLLQDVLGSFGKMGIVTEMIIKLDKMTCAHLKPIKEPLALAVPLPHDYKLPDYVPKELTEGISADDIKKANEEFTARVSHYYSEWFVWPFERDCYVNTWNNDGDPKKAVDYPGEYKTEFQEWMEVGARYFNKTLLQLFSEKNQAQILAKAGMAALSTKEVITPLIDGLHFQRGIQEMPVQDIEINIPVPADALGNPDAETIKKIVWDSIIFFYQWFHEKRTVPAKLPFEFRVMSGSDVPMACQHGNKFTLAAEFLTVGVGLVKDWEAFMQGWSDLIMGKYPNSRFHWAKQASATVKRGNQERKSYLNDTREQFTSSKARVNAALNMLAKQGNYSVTEFKRFSNSYLDQLFENKVPVNEKKFPAVDRLPHSAGPGPDTNLNPVPVDDAAAEAKLKTHAEFLEHLGEITDAYQKFILLKNSKEGVDFTTEFREATIGNHGVRFWKMPDESKSTESTSNEVRYKT